MVQLTKAFVLHFPSFKRLKLHDKIFRGYLGLLCRMMSCFGGFFYEIVDRASVLSLLFFLKFESLTRFFIQKPARIKQTKTKKVFNKMKCKYKRERESKSRVSVFGVFLIRIFLAFGLSMETLSGGIRVRIPQKLVVVVFWSWKLNVMVFQSWNLDVVAFIL